MSRSAEQEEDDVDEHQRQDDQHVGGCDEDREAEAAKHQHGQRAERVCHSRARTAPPALTLRGRPASQRLLSIATTSPFCAACQTTAGCPPRTAGSG